MPKQSGADEYELRATTSHAEAEADAEPLLPRYTAEDGGGTRGSVGGPSIKLVDKDESRRKRKKSKSLRKTIQCLGVAFLVLLLGFGLAGCLFGRKTLDSVRGWHKWEQVPPEWKEWLDTVIPPERQHADHGAFPTDIGYAGPTPTGSEAALLRTAPASPMYTGISPLIQPKIKHGSDFNIMQHWGNLSPYASVESHGLPETSGLIPENCELEEMHWLQRHGARYPTSYPDGPAAFAAKLRETGNWKASDDLEFLNDWEYKLGSELLTPFGRSQLFNLGVAARVKYGFLLDKMEGQLPVFRTETQDRMLKSAQNFAAGFFGIPAEDQYNLEVMIEAPGFNCTLAPWNACHNEGTQSSYWEKIREWEGIYLKDAHKRLQKQLDGYELSIHDVANMMEICPYETVALGYSKFCGLFTKKEWKGYQYRWDLYWYYSAAFGYPLARAQGIGYVEELVSRLTHTRLTEFDSTTNSSFHDDVHFPLNHPLYVDFTHDTMFALLLPTLNLTSFNDGGELPSDRIPKHRSFISSKICPFATNLQFQVMSCSNTKSIRLILNDGVVPLTGLRGCPEDEDGLCPLDTFVDALKRIIAETDFAAVCGARSVS